VFCEAGLAVLNDSISPNHKIFNVVVVENSQQIAEVGVDEHQALLLWHNEELIPRWHRTGLWPAATAKRQCQRYDPSPESYLCVPRN
ncbi:MAG: hypothetical protein KDE59_07970, partial [Anaerolineales bacterium]|nr:hypothetical protein [Anaerolineales bacterium]